MRIDARIEAIERGLSSLSKEFRRAYPCFCCSLAARRYEEYCKVAHCYDPKLAAETIASAHRNLRTGEIDRALEERARSAARELGEIPDPRAIAAQESCFTFMVLHEVFGGKDSAANGIRIVRLMRDTVDMLIQEEGNLPQNPKDLDLAIESHPVMQSLFDKLEKGLDMLRSANCLDEAMLAALNELAGWNS